VTTLQRLPMRQRPHELSHRHDADTLQNQKRRSNLTLRFRAIAPMPNATFHVSHECLHSTKCGGVSLGHRPQTTNRLGTTHLTWSDDWEEKPDESTSIRPQNCRRRRVLCDAAPQCRGGPNSIPPRAKAVQTSIGHEERPAHSQRPKESQRPQPVAPTPPPTCPNPSHKTKPHGNLGQQRRRIAPQFVRGMSRTRNGAISGRQATSSHVLGHVPEGSMRQ